MEWVYNSTFRLSFVGLFRSVLYWKFTLDITVLICVSLFFCYSFSGLSSATEEMHKNINIDTFYIGFYISNSSMYMCVVCTVRH